MQGWVFAGGWGFLLQQGAIGIDSYRRGEEKKEEKEEEAWGKPALLSYRGERKERWSGGAGGGGEWDEREAERQQTLIKF